jgi:hypothetical protein
MAQAAHTPDTPSGSPNDAPFDEVVGLGVRIDLALVDGLLALLGGRRVVTRREAVLFTVMLTRAPYYVAEGFVTDLVKWPGHPGNEQTESPPLVDALLDLRTTLMHGTPGSR